MNIKIRLEKDEDGIYVSTCPSLPGCISQGKTEKEALENIKEAVKLHLRCLAEDGIPLFEDKKNRIMGSIE
ncbi:type II toxin-antitoxin system HicB family antitoxin [Thermodesulfovibrionales bacterium]|nr:type II toxin-antitoxin system HicB family antitoxin [Thermodesulfovibrionales bacterium]